MNIKKYILYNIIGILSISMTACAKPNYSKAPNTPEMSSITDTPNDKLPATPVVPKDGTTDLETPSTKELPQGAPPTTVEVPKSSSPQGVPNSGSIENGATTTYMPTTNSSIPAIQVNTDYTFLAAVENEVLTLCNNERKKAGAPELTLDSKLRDIARYKAMEMLQYNYFNHVSPVSKKSPFDLASSFGYSYTAFAENIQSSQGKTSASVTAGYLVSNWMSSEGHKANILNPAFKRMGIGVVFSTTDNRAYESQMFSN